MQHKRHFYKNGIVIGVLMFIAGIFITGINTTAGPLIGTIGIVVFFVSLIRAIIRKIVGIIHAKFGKASMPTSMQDASNSSAVNLEPSSLEPAPLEPTPSEPVLLESEAQAIQPMSVPVTVEMSVPVTVEMSASATVEMSAPAPVEMSGSAPVEMSVSAPVEMSAPVPVEKMSPLEESIVPEPLAEDEEPAVYFEKLTVDEFVQEADKVGYVAFDFETTGFSSENDRIIEIGAVKMDANGNEIDRYSSLVNPERHISSKIAAITGIADDMVRTAPTIDRVLPGFLRFIHGYPLIAWNASFDKGFLEKNVCRCGLGCDAEYTDALAWARKVYDLPSYKQGLVADHIGYVPRNAHRALADCETLVAIVNDLRKNTTLEERVEVPHPMDNLQPDVTNPDIIIRGVSGLSENDEEVARYFISLILGKYTDAKLSIMQNNSYITLCIPGAYILRFHCGPYKKWVAIDSYRVELNREDELFAAQKNKDQRFWRSDFDKIESIHLYDEYVLNTYIKAITEQV